MCLAAYFMIFNVNRDEGAESPYGKFVQHQAELLQALLLRHKVDFYKGDIGTPDHVTIGIETASKLMEEHGSIYLADIPEDSAAHAKARVIGSMRMYTEVMRGEYYPEQLTRLFRPSLERINDLFIAAHGISPTTVFDLVQHLSLEIERRLNRHIKKVGTFFRENSISGVVKAYKKAFPDVELETNKLRERFAGMSEEDMCEQAKFMLISHSDLLVRHVFTVTRADIAEMLKKIDASADLAAAEAIIDKLSMSLGDAADKSIDHLFLDNPVWSRPFVKYADEFLLPLPTTFTSYCMDIFVGLSQVSDKLKTAYEEMRAKWLEEMSAALLKEAMPSGTIWRSLKWKDAATGKVFENDIAVLVDRWLILVEAKSGQVTDSARRGSFDRLKREIRKLMVDPSDQSKRLADLLMATKGKHVFDCLEGKCEIDSSALDGIIRINITNESIGTLNSRGGDLVEAELVPKETDLAPTMSLSSLDLVLQIIGTQNGVLHYFHRRKEFEANAEYMADELDLAVFYLERGFNIGEAEYDGTMLMIFGISNDLDARLTRIDHKIGKQESKAFSKYWDRFLNVLEASGRDGWGTLAMRLRNVGADEQAKLEKTIRKGVSRFKKDGPIFGAVILAPKERREGLLVLVTNADYKSEIEAEVRNAYRSLHKEGVSSPTMLVVEPPVAGVLNNLLIVSSEDEAVAAKVNVLL
jgi:hypothetical protein